MGAAALLARSQVDPGCADLDAFFALAPFRVFDGLNCFEMGAGLISHWSSHPDENNHGRLFVQRLMDERDRDRSLTDRRRHALDVAGAHVADREHAGRTRL